jgi:hypothetical protein
MSTLADPGVARATANKSSETTRRQCRCFATSRSRLATLTAIGAPGRLTRRNSPPDWSGKRKARARTRASGRWRCDAAVISPTLIPTALRPRSLKKRSGPTAATFGSPGFSGVAQGRAAAYGPRGKSIHLHRSPRGRKGGSSPSGGPFFCLIGYSMSQRETSRTTLKNYMTYMLQNSCLEDVIGRPSAQMFKRNLRQQFTRYE